VNTPALNTALERAIALFEYREQATGRRLLCDPDWPRVMSESLKSAIAGERGNTDQQQCAYQAIRLAMWESGWFRAPWTKAFVIVSTTPPLAWYRRWWKWLLKRLNDLF
jgi:hypothetical protein